MGDNTCERPETESFWLWDGLLLLFPGPSETPEPGRTLAAKNAARSLMAQMPRIEHTLRRWKAPESELEDLAQTVVVEVWPWWLKRHTAENDTGRADPVAYVLAAAKNCVRRRLRRMRLRGELDAVPEVAQLIEDLAVPSVEEEIIEAELRAERALLVDLDVLSSLLGPAKFRAVYGFYVLHVPVSEIAKSEQAAAPTVYDRLRLARADVRAAIKRPRTKRKK